MSPEAADALSVRPGGDADIPAVIELMKLSLGEGNVPRTSEFWHWKHRRNPFGPSPMWLAHADQKLVGVRLFLRWGLRAGAHDYSALRAVDTATHPEFQGKGIFKRLTLKLVEAETAAGTHLIFNTPNDKSRPGYLKMGWSAAGRLSLWIRPVSPLRLLRAALSKPEAASDESNDLLGVAADAFAVPGLAGLFGAGERAGYHTDVTSEYLAWRYTAPGISYGLQHDSDAAIVYRLRRRGALRELRICELPSQGRSLAAFGALRGCLQQLLRRHRPDYVVCAFRPEPGDVAMTAALGFIPAPRLGPILTVRPLNLPPAAPDPRGLKHWSASIGDLELF